MPAWSASRRARRRFGDMIKIGRRGSMTVDLVVRGIQGHVGYPERLDNPIHRLSALIEALVREPIDEGSTHFQPTSLQFTTVDVGNKATNIAPGAARRASTCVSTICGTPPSCWRTSRSGSSGPARRWAATARSRRQVEVSGKSLYTPPGPLGDLVAGAIRDVGALEPELSTTGGIRMPASSAATPGAGVRPGRRDHAQGRREERGRRPQGAGPRLRDGARPLFRGLGDRAQAAEIARGIQGALGFLQHDRRRPCASRTPWKRACAPSRSWC